MADEVEMTEEATNKFNALNIEAIRQQALNIPAGVTGVCVECERTMPRLVNGVCCPCRDLHGLP